MKTVLDQLRDMTVVVADTGDVTAVKRYQPIDCTTNPSLVLAALSDPASEEMIVAEIEAGRKAGLSALTLTDTLTVAVGARLSGLVPGRVSTEVDARLSFDTDASVARARAILADYAERGVDRQRILIKLASTWEGIRAAEILQDEGTDCNLTLLFSMAQAVACATAGAYLISPFVGGGFGGKLFLRSDTILAALAAREARRAVKLALPRPFVANNTTHRPATIQRIRLGAAKDGRLTAIAHETGFADQAHFTRSFRRAAGMSPGTYRRIAAGA